MKTFTWIASLTLGCLLAATPALGQATDAARQNLHHGEITAIDHAAKTFTIETRSGAEQFTLWQGAEVLGADARTSFDALAVGEEVAVRSIQDENERFLARSVQVLNPNELEGQLEDHPAFDVADTVTVIGVDLEAQTLAVETAQGPRSYHVSEQSRIQRGGQDVELETLRAKERVVVSARETSPGVFTATTVTVVNQSPAPADRAAASGAD